MEIVQVQARQGSQDRLGAADLKLLFQCHLGGFKQSESTCFRDRDAFNSRQIAYNKCVSII
jgi:hypothetical protein